MPYGDGLGLGPGSPRGILVVLGMALVVLEVVMVVPCYLLYSMLI